jgi:hypothetical protein
MILKTFAGEQYPDRQYEELRKAYSNVFNDDLARECLKVGSVTLEKVLEGKVRRSEIPELRTKWKMLRKGCQKIIAELIGSD